MHYTSKISENTKPQNNLKWLSMKVRRFFCNFTKLQHPFLSTASNKVNVGETGLRQRTSTFHASVELHMPHDIWNVAVVRTGMPSAKCKYLGDRNVFYDVFWEDRPYASPPQPEDSCSHLLNDSPTECAICPCQGEKRWWGWETHTELPQTSGTA